MVAAHLEESKASVGKPLAMRAGRAEERDEKCATKHEAPFYDLPRGAGNGSCRAVLNSHPCVAVPRMGGRGMPFKTALVAAPLLLLIAGLGLAISMRRRREGIGPGMAGDVAFTRLQRAHGNAVEHSPMLLLGLLFLEL